MDWDAYWAGGGDDAEAMRDAGKRNADRLDRFSDEPLSPLASVGCGSGELLLTYAERNPDATVVGYDASTVVVERAREAAVRRGFDVTFETETLPAFDPGRTFKCVVCFSTLHYVTGGKRALSAMFDTVDPGGHLIATYPSPSTRAVYREQAEDPDTSFPTDRFRKVLDGESVLTEAEVESALGVPTRSFWHAVDDPAADEVAEPLPCVVARKPR